jgi:hypothetical protein
MGEKIAYTHEIATADIEKVGNLHPELLGFSPYELFSKYFDEHIRDMIVKETIRYAQQKNNTQFSLDSADLDVFVGIILLSGYHSLPRERMYWNRDEDVKIPFVSSRMSRRRFLEIKKYVHLVDNE